MKRLLNKEKFQQLLIRWVLVVLPTVLIGYVTLRFINFSYTSFNTGIVSQTAYFALGILSAYTLYYYGARLAITLLLLWFVYWLFEKAIDKLPGEFDMLYANARFLLFSTLFIFGWAFGFLLARIKWSYIITAGLFAMVTLVAISATIDVSLGYILLHLFPVVLYGLYMLFLSPLLDASIELSWTKALKLVARLVAFVILILLAFVITDFLLMGEVKAVEKELAARGAKGKDGRGAKDKDNYDERNGLMEKGKGGKGDDGYRLKDTMRVNSKMSQSDKLMFCSKLDNYFPDGEPIPLYFVYHYLTRYDPVKESFTRDVNVPSFDEIEADPTRLPMYYSFTDTSIVRKSQANKFRKIVEAQVYLSENTWKHSVLGPSSVFSIQTIPVEKDFQKTFLSAYKIYAFASDLNNAYFVYNISASPKLEPLQDQRHNELRSIKNYRGTDRAFFEYYTDMPSGGIYDSIAQLAQKLVPKDASPIDKVLAVRDFFLQRNENGKRLFRYTLKAGAVDDPNIPSSKMLYDFLFKTHAGYCTYYAGASHFMLRALGVPTRFTTGFATVNRSDKNKGWYWFYASQAHAWTQVYFPGYGWLDFDMTIGNEDQQSAPKPDGTPPLPPPDPWLVLNAKAESVNMAVKKFEASFNQLIYFTTPHQLNKIFTRNVDASLCRVLYNERDTTLSALKAGDSVIIISYKDEAKKIPQPRAGVSIEQQVASFPSPIIADEIHIRAKKKEEKPQDGKGRTAQQQAKKVTWQEIAWVAAKVITVLSLLILGSPLLYLFYRLARIAFAKDIRSKAHHVYRASLYRFHMAGFERETQTPLEYAEKTIDPNLHVGFADFMRMYLRLKYSNGSVREGDADKLHQFANKVAASVRAKKGLVKAVLNYFNIIRASRYFQTPISSEPETTTL
ncbi:MAG: transglutaminase domain-containing protein [Cytophagales bacterium]